MTQNMNGEVKTLELFCGTKSFSKVAKEFGYETKTLDNEDQFNADFTMDIMDFNVSMLGDYKPDIIWASPPCQKFSVASFSTHWNPNRVPKNKDTVKAMDIIKKTVEIIEEINPKYFYIENPRAMLRKLDLIPYPYTTVTYCQYGFTNMKPTDIWSNNSTWQMVAKSCKNGMSCHESAPRGSKTGTQGIKNAMLRGAIPPNLIKEILEYGEVNV